MALHIVPKGQEERHQHADQCPCVPTRAEGHATVGTGRNVRQYQGVIYQHQELPAVPADDVAGLPDEGIERLYREVFGV